MTAPFITDYDLHLLSEGRHYRSYEKLGAHVCEQGGTRGVHFAVTAPNAERVSVMGDFNDWDPDRHPLHPRDNSGIWEGFVAGVRPGHLYKYRIHSRIDGYQVEKADPDG